MKTNSSSYKVLFFVIFCFYFLVSIDQAVAAKGGNDLQAWVGTHTRIVWLQDQGQGSDTFARGHKLMLYGYDSQDGKGERPLLPNIGNLFKPLFTPDGQHVLVSNRLARMMYLVEWDTGRVKELGSGVAVAVWQDPKPSLLLRKKTTWVYYFKGLKPENMYGTSQPLYRFDLNNPKKKELIWNSTNLAWSNLQLSRDGKIIGGLFPWPHGGILSLEDNTFKRFGRGCWTSLSPDNSKLLWIFDGLHRNLYFYDVLGTESWKVQINTAPGIDGFEVYHPRWSNHPRYFVMTGPYEKGEGGNKITGGGEKVEVYIGRFNEAVKDVDDWFKLTSNNKADFYPEMWVEGGEKVDLSDETVAENKVEKNALQWPVASTVTSQLFSWQNMKAANQLTESSPLGFYQCSIELRGKALYTHDFQLDLTGGWGDSSDAGTKIGKVLESTGKASMEFVVQPQRLQTAPIASLMSGDKPVFSIWQHDKSIVLQNSKGDKTIWKEILTPGKQTHFVATVSGTHAALFVGGKSKGQQKFAINLANSNINQFMLGDKQGSWHGKLETIGVYNRPLKEAEIVQSFGFVVAEIKAESAQPTDPPIVLEGTLLEMTDIPAPDSIGAYRRALVVNSYTVDKVIDGKYEEGKILVAEWAVLDRKIVKKYNGTSQSEKLILEKFDDHPELEGERQMMDIFEPDLEMYYRLPTEQSS